MDADTGTAEQLSAALLELEDSVFWNLESGLTAAVGLLRQAEELADETLVVRARLCLANILLRTGEVAVAARQIYELHEWALTHDDRRLRSRSHLACANVERLCGDAAKVLEHTISAVELLDETATPFMQVWHHTRLADALATNGEIRAARVRFKQAEELARQPGLEQRLLIVLNNWAYRECRAGEFTRAQQVAERLLAEAAAMGVELDPTALDTIGAIQIGNGQYAEAEQTMRACIALHESGLSDDVDDLPDYLLTLATAQRGLGATDAAQNSLDSCRALCIKHDLHEILVRVHEEQAELHAARGAFGAAFLTYKTFHAAHENLRSRQRQAQAQTRQAILETAEARQQAERFREQARRDPLTGLRNRRYVNEVLPDMIEGDAELTVALIDLDHFKRINDELSHDIGDQVLARVATLMETELTAAVPDGFVARLGGEEFLLVLPATPPDVAVQRLNVIRRAIRGYAWTQITGALPVTVSIGVASVGDVPDADQTTLLGTADRNLYVAKRSGRDRVVACPGWAEHQIRDAAKMIDSKGSVVVGGQGS